MKIQGLGDRSVAEVQHLVGQGGKFVIYSYCISILVMTFKRGTDVFFIPPGQGRVGPGIPYVLISFFFGWWGFPFGLIYTPMAIIQNLSGGKDVTHEMMSALGASAVATAPVQQGSVPNSSGWVGPQS